jgi:hypothetical protein
MKVSGQLHAPAALLPGQITPDTHLKAGWTQSQSGRYGEEKDPVPAGNRTPDVQSVAVCYTDSIRTVACKEGAMVERVIGDRNGVDSNKARERSRNEFQ